MEIGESIHDDIVESFPFGDDSPLAGDGISVLESGIVDSAGVMELVVFLKKDHGVAVDAEDLVPQDLDSIDDLEGSSSRIPTMV